MSKGRFDFSEINAALPAAEKMQERDRLTDALENNYMTVGILSDKVEKLENRLSETLTELDRAVSSLCGRVKLLSARSSGVCLSEKERRFVGR